MRHGGLSSLFGGGVPGALAGALERAREGVLLVDGAGRVTFASRQLASFFPHAAPYLVAGADFSVACAAIGPALEAPEFQLACGRWIRVSRSEAPDGGFLVIVSDVTDIKERELSSREATEQAQAASLAKSSFLANMSHELRTPLNAIIGFSEIMSGEMFGPIANEHYAQYIEDIVQSGRHLLDVINSVLDLAKSEAGKLEIDAGEVDLAEVLDNCVTMIGEQCVRAGLRLEAADLPQPAIVLGEAAKLRQVFLNLLSNAMKFTEPGGSVSIGACITRDGAIAVTVADTGIGMTPGDLAIAVAPFGQVDSRLARRFEGTGLGLPLAKSLVELHGGMLAIESTPGVGTVVTVTLPLAAGTYAEPALLRAAG